MKYLAFASCAFQSRLAYRSQIWAQLVAEFAAVIAKIAIWTSLISARGSAGGVSRADMLTYSMLGASVASSWEWQKFLQRLGNQVRTGDVAAYFTRPASFPAIIFFEALGSVAFKALFVMAPVIVTVTLVYGISPPASAWHAALFAGFWVVAFLILFALGAIFALFSFWLMTTFSLEWLLLGMLTILSGGFIPFWFYPEALAPYLVLQPLAWVGFHPMAVYLGKYSVTESLAYLAGGMGWLGILALAAALLWRTTARRLVVQGG